PFELAGRTRIGNRRLATPAIPPWSKTGRTRQRVPIVDVADSPPTPAPPEGSHSAPLHTSFAPEIPDHAFAIPPAEVVRRPGNPPRRRAGCVMSGWLQRGSQHS